MAKRMTTGKEEERERWQMGNRRSKSETDKSTQRQKEERRNKIRRWVGKWKRGSGG